MKKRIFRNGLIVVIMLVTVLTAAVVSASGEWEQINGFSMTNISMISAEAGWGVSFPCGGDSNEISVYRWDGTAWNNWYVLFGEEPPCRGAIQMVSETDGWIAIPNGFNGDATDLHRWTGSDWILFTTIEHPGSLGIVNFDMLNANDIYASSGAGVQAEFFHWNGTEWRLQGRGPGGNFTGRDISMVSATDGWSIGAFESISRWDGSSWSAYTPQGQTEGDRLFAIDMVSADDGWIVGNNGLIKRWQNGDWSDFPSPTDAGIRDVEMLNASVGYASTDLGEILRWDGTNWTVVADLTGNLSDIEMFDANNGFAGGSHHARLQGGNEPPTSDDGDCIIPSSGPWPPCATGGGDAPPPSEPPTDDSGECVIPESGPWPPCATGGDAPADGDCVIPPSGPWPPCATEVAPPADLPEGCVVPPSGPWPACARVLLIR